MPTYPNMFRIRQHFDAPRIDNIASAVRGEIAKIDPRATIKPGQTVAIAAGSRGVANIDTIIKTIVKEMQAIGAAPIHRARDGIARRRHSRRPNPSLGRLWHHRARYGLPDQIVDGGRANRGVGFWHAHLL